MKLLFRFENIVLVKNKKKKKCRYYLSEKQDVDTILIKNVVYSVLVKEGLWML